MTEGHIWSSYAGYEPKPEWLTCESLWRRAGTGKGKDAEAGYWRYLEEYLRQGVEEGAFTQITSAVVIGGAAFVERLRRKVPPSVRSDTNARAWRRRLPFGEVMKGVESVKGEEWGSFARRHTAAATMRFFSSRRTILGWCWARSVSSSWHHTMTIRRSPITPL